MGLSSSVHTLQLDRRDVRVRLELQGTTCDTRKVHLLYVNIINSIVYILAEVKKT